MKPLFYSAGNTPALTYAIGLLKKAGIAFTDHTDLCATHLLLPVPSFTPEQTLVGGGHIESILPQLSDKITVIGGNLSHKALEGYGKLDLLHDETYLASNAAITAHCALKYILNNIPYTLTDRPVLVIGWGRIGKCLAQLLRSMGARVTVAARKSADRAILDALGYGAAPIDGLDPSPYGVIVNTAPAPVLRQCDGLKIDLASKQGISGQDVICARGLPGKDAPEASGKLIAQCILRSISKEGVLP